MGEMGSTETHPDPTDAGLPSRSAPRGYVDYERVAALYRRGRSLPPEVLKRWGDAVRPYVPADVSVVVDVGAGTGVFTDAWSDWTGASVVAVEPAAAMVKASTATQPSVTFVRAVAEALPIRDDQAGVIWVSAALHHFADVERATAEFRRVLCPGGRVLLRTYLPGRTESSWAEKFPGKSKWLRRFHAEDELRAMFSAAGFDLRELVEVLEWRESYAASAQWVSTMRHADSMLTALSDAEIAEGLDALHSEPERVGRIEQTLLVFEPNG